MLASVNASVGTTAAGTSSGQTGGHNVFNGGSIFGNPSLNVTGGAGTVAVNLVENTLDAKITGTTTIAGSGAVSVTATDTTFIVEATDVSIDDAIWTGIATNTLTVSTSGAGSGSVSSSPVGISCGSTCSTSFNYNTSVTLKLGNTSAKSAGL